jgi:hypothetical protein
MPETALRRNSEIKAELSPSRLPSEQALQANRTSFFFMILNASACITGILLNHQIPVCKLITKCRHVTTFLSGLRFSSKWLSRHAVSGSRNDGTQVVTGSGCRRHFDTCWSRVEKSTLFQRGPQFSNAQSIHPPNAAGRHHLRSLPNPQRDFQIAE